MKIKGYRFPCEVCGENKIVSSIQVFFRKNGEVSYARARHYGADKKFYYHQQSLEYTNRRLRELTNIDPTIDLHKESKTNIVEQTNNELRSKLGLVAGGEGFEPSTPNLGGWCSIRTELLAQLDSYFKTADTYTNPSKIKKLLLHLGGKGKSETNKLRMLGELRSLFDVAFHRFVR